MKKIINIKEGDKITYGTIMYDVAEIKQFPHGPMVGIYDEPPSKHIDYLNPESVKVLYPCNNCQGGGCHTCCATGYLPQDVQIEPDPQCSTCNHCDLYENENTVRSTTHFCKLSEDFIDDIEQCYCDDYKQE